MAVNVETISENIFAILKGYGFTIRMFDDIGKKVIKPEDARRFFLTDSNLVITSSEEEIKVHLGKSVTFDEAKDTINTIKQLAKKYMMDFNLKKFGHILQPKDYVFDLKKEADMDSIQESAFSKSYGSSKSSYQDVGNTRLVVRHAAPVNEESRGSRARNIKSIYIENAEGERFKFPSKNLLSARAMARHIANKGTPFDDGGKNIISLDEELGQLKNFVRYTRQNFKEENESVSGLHELAIMRVNNIKEDLNKIKSSRTYNEAIQSINNDQIKNEEVEGELQEVLTKHTFDESLTGVLPYLATLVSEGTILERLELALLEGKIELGLFEDDDINNPSNFAFDSVTLKNQHWLKYIGEKAIDEKVSALVTEIAEGFDVMEVADRNKALRLVKNNITFENQEKPDITDVIEESLDKQLSKYTSNDIFFEKSHYKGAPDNDSAEGFGIDIPVGVNRTSGYGDEGKKRRDDTRKRIQARKDKMKDRYGMEYKDVGGGAVTAVKNESEVEEGISHTDPKTGKKIYPGTPEWKAKFIKKPKQESAEKPDYLDFDKDGDKKEPMKKALNDKKKKTKVEEEPNEGNEFSGALAQARKSGKKEFSVGGKTFKVKESEEVSDEEKIQELLQLAGIYK